MNRRLSLFFILFVPFLALAQQPVVSNRSGKKGLKLFEQYCGSCHNFLQDGIGPHLGGIGAISDKAFIPGMIRNAQNMIDNGNTRALILYKKFRTVMPSFEYLKENEIEALMAFISEQPEPAKVSSELGSAIENPIPEKIESSGIVLNIEPVLQFPFTNEREPRTRITKMDVHPLTGEKMVVDLQGQLYKISENNKPLVYLDLANEFKNFINVPGLATGFGSFAFHPEFEKNGLFYTTHTEPAGTRPADFAYADSIPVKLQWIVEEWQTDNPQTEVFEGKSRELFRIDMVTQIHGMQEIAFNPYAKNGDDDYGLLFIGLGDGGAVEQGYDFIPRGKEMAWGKVYRIDPKGRNSKNGRYGIPASNPFVGDPKAIQETYAMGFRNANRIHWLKDGRMLVSNIGQRQIESLYLINKPGADSGWPDREGTFRLEADKDINFVFPLPENDADYNYPIAQYDHDEGNAIIGGFE
jgi:mono/diheme cytochrome c family protein